MGCSFRKKAIVIQLVVESRLAYPTSPATVAACFGLGQIWPRSGAFLYIKCEPRFSASFYILRRGRSNSDVGARCSTNLSGLVRCRRLCCVYVSISITIVWKRKQKDNGRSRIAPLWWPGALPNCALAMASGAFDLRLNCGQGRSRKLAVDKGAPELRPGHGRSRMGHCRWPGTLPIAPWRWPGPFPNGAVAIPNDIPEKHLGDGQGWSRMCLGDCQKLVRTAHGCDMLALPNCVVEVARGAPKLRAGNCQGRCRIAR